MPNDSGSSIERTLVRRESAPYIRANRLLLKHSHMNVFCVESFKDTFSRKKIQKNVEFVNIFNYTKCTSILSHVLITFE